MHALLRFLALYALMYGAYGVASPFLPAFFERRGLASEQLGLLLGTGTAIRLIAGPLWGRLADLTGALRGVLAICAALAAVVAVSLLSVAGVPALFALSLLHAAALAPITTLADALALGASAPRRAAARFEYGWLRGTGSGVFVLGTLVSGQVVGAWGLGSILVLQAAQLTLAACTALLVPAPAPSDRVDGIVEAAPRQGVAGLLRSAEFRRVMLVSALVLGSHALHDTFAVIRWSAAGIGPAMVSVLWSESVAAEVVVFFLVGPVLLKRLGASRVMALAATAGLVRWLVVASTTAVTPLALVQPLHGLTFAALHLACMRVIPAITPPGLAATAQAMYALGAGATTAVLTLAAGHLYARLGGHAFVVMALLCAAATPLALGLRPPRPPRAGH
ncbi:MAG TPA: MFS transporter [Methylomirabilota bacterium]|jgi:PPP family 3-phenylpropionic acid transporter